MLITSLSIWRGSVFRPLRCWLRGGALSRPGRLAAASWLTFTRWTAWRTAALLAWARGRAGARDASLQMAAENAGTLALYAGLGFRTELFRHRYRRQPAA